MEKFNIVHGLFKNHTGSSILSSSQKYVCSTIDGPYDTSTKEDDFESLNIEIKCKVFTSSKDFENLCCGLVNRILNRYLVKDSLLFKSIEISIYSNTTDLYLICNAVIITCLDAGIPLSDMIYCVGDKNLFVFRNDVIDFCHSYGPISVEEINEAKNSKNYIENNIKDAFRDVFNI